MRILAIMGGPRKGYGTMIMQQLEYQLKLIQKVEFEYLYLKDVNLELCRGCHNCFFKGEDKCPVGKDDRDVIFKQKHVNQNENSNLFHIKYWFNADTLGIIRHDRM